MMEFTRRLRRALPCAIALFVLVTTIGFGAMIDLPSAAEAGVVDRRQRLMITDSSLGNARLNGHSADPKISGRISRRYAIGTSQIRARGLASAISNNAVAALQVRRIGARSWRTVARRAIRAGRKFELSWRGERAGRYTLRLSVVSAGKRVSDYLGAAFVFRRSFASWYGPGFYGGRTACGQRLTGSIVGVAHKSLACGTRVTFHNRGHTVTARVVDRGPFVGGREWDLTPALKRRLHFGSTGVVHVTR